MFKFRGRAGVELGTLWSEGRDLIDCTNHARPSILKLTKGSEKLTPDSVILLNWECFHIIIMDYI